MMNKFSLMILFIIPVNLSSQVVLEADGPGNTYELISSVLAPGADAVENPECVHPEFGRHIAEVWDDDLGQYVFEFYSHVAPDNDRCINFDRQRIEIKTYDPSPDYLRGTLGETITYQWRFKLPVGFQPSSSFTHIHQIKAVGGDDGNPLFTLTPRKGSPDKLELIHDNTTKVKIANLSLFEGVWVECKEIVTVGASGTYSMTMRSVKDGTVLLSYGSSNIMTIRSDNNFIRPKWGIYRSLDHPTDLRNEAVRFAGFSIQEGTTAVKGSEISFPTKDCLDQNYPNPFNPTTTIRYQLLHPSHVILKVFNALGQEVATLVNAMEEPGYNSVQFDASHLSSGVYFYRLQSGGYVACKKLLILK